jgi:hypothetical protein
MSLFIQSIAYCSCILRHIEGGGGGFTYSGPAASLGNILTGVYALSRDEVGGQKSTDIIIFLKLISIENDKIL